MIMAGVLLATGCGGPAALPAETPPALTAFVLRGSVGVSAEYSGSYEDGTACVAKAGYDDIAEGAQITVKGPDGTKLAVGSLEAGQIKDIQCRFSFTVYDVPEGHDLYDVAVGSDRRGAVTYRRDQMDSGIVMGFS